MQESIFCFICENGFYFGISFFIIVFLVHIVVFYLAFKLLIWAYNAKKNPETNVITISPFGIDISIKGFLAYVTAEVLIIIALTYSLMYFLPNYIQKYSVSMDASSRPTTLSHIKEKLHEETELKIKIPHSLKEFEVTGVFKGKCVANLFKSICDLYDSDLECEWSLKKRTFSLSPKEKGALARKLIFFDKNSEKLTHTEENKLNLIAEKAKVKPNLDIVLYGYADDTGTKNYNLQLITRRINTVKNYIVKRGVEKSRIKIGERLVIKSEKDSRKKNRRVEIIFNKI